MTPIKQSFAVLMLVALASLAGADVRYPAPGVSADVLPQQSTDKPAEETKLEEDEDEDEDEDEEPDCE